MAVIAWSIDPALAIYYAKRFKQQQIESQVVQLVTSDSKKVTDNADAIEFLLKGQFSQGDLDNLKVSYLKAHSCALANCSTFCSGFL